jgi:hypothetical protein
MVGHFAMIFVGGEPPIARKWKQAEARIMGRSVVGHGGPDNPFEGREDEEKSADWNLAKKSNVKLINWRGREGGGNARKGRGI